MKKNDKTKKILRYVSSSKNICFQTSVTVVFLLAGLCVYGDVGKKRAEAEGLTTILFWHCFLALLSAN